MPRCRTALATAILASYPSVGFAQAAPKDWSAIYAGPLLVGGVLVLLAIGALFAFRGGRGVGIALWTLVMTAGGSLSVFALQGTILGEPWQLPALLAGFVGFVFAGLWALNRLSPRPVDAPNATSTSR